MTWADYRQGAKKAKVHLGYDIARGIPKKVILTDGKGDERPQVENLVAPGQTAVLDRYYQCYKNFDEWQEQGRHFVCRIKPSARKTVLRENSIDADSHVFYDAVVLLGTQDINLIQREVRVVGYKADGKSYRVATDGSIFRPRTSPWSTSCAGPSRPFSAGGSAISKSIT